MNRIPRLRVDCCVVAPNDEHPDQVDERNQQNFGQHRVSEPHRLGDCRLEALHVFFGDKISFEELCDEKAHAVMHHQLSPDQQRYDHQKSDMNFYILQEGNGRTATKQLPLPRRQNEERQPANQGNEENAPVQQLQTTIRHT